MRVYTSFMIELFGSHHWTGPQTEAP